MAKSIILYGAPMQFAGFGAFPYPCKAQDKHPNAAVYYGGSCWTHEYAEDFKTRNKEQDSLS